MVKDLSLLPKGPEEDEVFSSDPELWLNIRRGNTLLELYDPVDYKHLLKVLIGRKGLNKFFDLKYDFVTKEDRYRDEQLNNYEYNLKMFILAPVKKALLDGHKVEVVTTLKANGENMQVSWNPEVKAWLIASKNVSIVAADEKDLDLYPTNGRYSFAGLMAACWFREISHFKKKDLDQLK